MKKLNIFALAVLGFVVWGSHAYASNGTNVFRENGTLTYTTAPLIEEDEPGAECGTFTTSNELNPYLLQNAYDQLEPGGALISVGTFRTLIAAGMGKFDRIVLLDFDSQTTEFNKTHLDLLRAISRLNIPAQYQRFQYFAALHGRWLSDTQLRHFSSMENEDQQEHSWKKALLEEFDHSASNGEQLNLQFSAEILPLAQKLSNLAFKDSDGGKLPNNTGNGLLSGFYRYRSRTNRPAYYWENDYSWRKVRQLILKEAGAIAIVGNLVGNHAFISLGKFLMKKEGHVSAIDVSNATQFLDPYYSSYYSMYGHDVIGPLYNGNSMYNGNYSIVLSPKTEHKALESLEALQGLHEKFLSNIFSLPLSSDALLIKTDSTADGQHSYNQENVKYGKVQMKTNPEDFWEYSWRRIEDLRNDFKIGDWAGTMLPSAEDLIKMGGTTEEAERLLLFGPYFHFK